MTDPQKADLAGLAPLPTTSEALFSHFERLSLSYKLYRHDPVFTVEESQHLTETIPGTHCRNLFVRDKKEIMFLVVVPNETKVDMKKLEGVLGCARLSFGSPDRLWKYLGVRPGSVCPYSIINDTGNNVRIVLDKGMMAADLVTYHPMENHMSVTMTPADLTKFIESTGHVPHIIDLKDAAP